jgi:DNA polymerase
MNTQAQKKQVLLNALYEPYKKCMACPLATLGRKNVVFGEGNPDAKLMFIGEGPGQEEDSQARPFVGRSGKLLTRILTMLGVERSQVFITNIVKCRPPQNRKPLPLESATCKNLLLFKQIQIIEPKVICTLGATALEALLEKEIKIGAMRGKETIFNNIVLIPTFHPAYILRNPNELEKITFDIQTAIKTSALV